MEIKTDGRIVGAVGCDLHQYRRQRVVGRTCIDRAKVHGVVQYINIRTVTYCSSSNTVDCGTSCVADGKQNFKRLAAIGSIVLVSA